MNQQDRAKAIEIIRNTPDLLRTSIEGLNKSQMNTPYREGGWSPSQVVHHIADSHMHAYLRTKFILTENHPTLTPYDQDSWAKLSDATSSDASTSLNIIDGLHNRWSQVFSSLNDDQWKRTAFHPERGELSIEDILEMYASHGPHHVQQIAGLRKQKNW